MAFTISCTPRDEKESINKFGSPILLKIHEFQDRRLADSLLQFFDGTNPVYCEAALMAFASIQDSSAVEYIGNLLIADADINVRTAAAFALGQTECVQSKIFLTKALQKERVTSVRNEIILAYGKVGDEWNGQIMPEDSSGIAWSIYRAGLRGIMSEKTNDLACQLLRSRDENTRLGAAHYLARPAKVIQCPDYIIALTQRDTSTTVRMALALALRKIKTDESMNAAIAIIQNDSDYRVRINAIRALQSFPFPKIKEALLQALSDKNGNTRIVASETVILTLDDASWKDMLPLCRKTSGRVQANLYEAVLSASDNKEVAEEVIALFKKTNDTYHKASLLGALRQSVMSFGFVQEQMLASQSPVIRSTAANTLVTINYRKNFDPSLKNRFADIYEKGIRAGDPAVIGILSSALADSSLGFKRIVADFAFLLDARQKLRIPRDIESIQPLDAAIAYFEGKNAVAPDKPFNHPIDWKLIESIPLDQSAIITTTKGDIKVRLFVDKAPGSVANFVALSRSKYYEGKTFHRIVPNFVVQTGCNRGDGYGGGDYSIRSEFSTRRYSTGSLGMASAGKDTEGTQWFITHSPTPHLDGGYTIFGEVIEGMDVVHNLEVGDKILKIQLAD